MLQAMDFLNLFNIVAFSFQGFFGFSLRNVPLFWFNFISGYEVFTFAAILKSRIEEVLLDGFEAGVDLALRETNLRLRTFPEHCPYLFDDAIADHFLCDTRQDWEG